MNSIFSFDAMLTTKIITFVYWMLLLVSVVFGVEIMLDGSYGLSVESFFIGLAIIIGGAIFSRVLCELMIVVFKINENLQKIVERE